jgi:putative addiction module component (TIGR02574 family)
MTDPDPLAALLALSIAERVDAIERLADSLAAEADGPRLMRKLRSALDRRLRTQARKDGPPGAWGQSRSGFPRRSLRPPRAGG